MGLRSYGAIVVREEMGGAPVNVRPKINSLAGTSSFGVVVLVMDSFEGSMSCSLFADAAWAWMLYACACRHVAAVISLEAECAALGRN